MAPWMWISLGAIAVTLLTVVTLMIYVPVWWAKITRRPNSVSEEHHRRRKAHARNRTERARRGSSWTPRLATAIT